MGIFGAHFMTCYGVGETWGLTKSNYNRLLSTDGWHAPPGGVPARKLEARIEDLYISLKIPCCMQMDQQMDDLEGAADGLFAFVDPTGRPLQPLRYASTGSQTGDWRYMTASVEEINGAPPLRRPQLAVVGTSPLAHGTGDHALQVGNRLVYTSNVFLGIPFPI